MSLLSVYQHGFKRGIVFKFADFATCPAACAFLSKPDSSRYSVFVIN